MIAKNESGQSAPSNIISVTHSQKNQAPINTLCRVSTVRVLAEEQVVGQQLAQQEGAVCQSLRMISGCAEGLDQVQRRQRERRSVHRCRRRV